MTQNRLHDLLKPVTDALRDIAPELVDSLHTLTARLNGKLDEEEARLLAWVTTHLAAQDAVIDEPTAETPDQLAEQTTAEQEQATAPAQLGDPSATGVVDGAQGAGTVGQGADPTAVDNGQPLA